MINVNFWFLARHFDPFTSAKCKVPTWFFFYPDPFHVARAVCRLCAEQNNRMITNTCAKDNTRTINSHLRRNHKLKECDKKIMAAKRLGKVLMLINFC